MMKLKGGARSHVPTSGPEVECVRVSVSSDTEGEKTRKGRKWPHFPPGDQRPIFPENQNLAMETHALRLPCLDVLGSSRLRIGQP